MGLSMSAIPVTRHQIIVPDNMPVDHPLSPWVKYILQSSYFRHEIVIRLKSLVIQRNNLIGICLPNAMDSMLVFVMRHSSRRKVKTVEFRRKITRWHFQNLFFPIGEISLGVLDPRSGVCIHAMRTGCLQEGQTVRILVLKRGSSARLLPAARSQHWAQQNTKNNAIVDMFENVRERERFDEVDDTLRGGALKVFYVDEHIRYIRETSRGPIDPDEMPYSPEKDIIIRHPRSRSVFVWFILVCHDGRVFQSRQIRVYSRMFFRNKFGMHACEQFEADEQEVVKLKETKEELENVHPSMAEHVAPIIEEVDSRMQQLGKVAAVKSPTDTPYEEERRLDMMVNRSPEDSRDEAMKVQPEQLSAATSRPVAETL